MTDTPAEVEAARALVAAYDALNSPEHEQDITERRALDNQRLAVHERICARESAYAVHLTAKQKRDEAACATGTPAADNTEAAHVINGDEDIEDLTHLFAEDDDEDEFSTPRANGVLS